MSDKYIIKNCPCYNKDYSCQSKDNITGKYCQDCTDCTMKQAVELCRERSSKCERCKAYEDYQPTDCLDCSTDDVVFANDILQLFEIEEVE